MDFFSSPWKLPQIEYLYLIKGFSAYNKGQLRVMQEDHLKVGKLGEWGKRERRGVEMQGPRSQTEITAARL